MGRAKKILPKRKGFREFIVIFVTVGTHEQQFDRLVQKIDMLKKTGKIKEDVFIQSGYTHYIPRRCDHAKFITFEEMLEKIRQSRITITHGGPGSIMSIRYQGKIPIVVPRQKKYHEHIDNHQLAFTKKLAEKGTIIPVYRIENLENRIKNHKNLTAKLKDKGDGEISPNKKVQNFATAIDSICTSLLKKKKF